MFGPSHSLRAVALAGLCLTLCTAASFQKNLERGERRLEEGHYAEAAKHLEAAVAERAGERPVRQIQALMGLADAYVTDPGLGKEEAAGPLLDQARSLAEEELASDSDVRLAVLGRQGNLYVLLSSWQRAREPLETWLAIAAKRFGPERAYDSLEASNLLSVYTRLGLGAEAEELRGARTDPRRAAELASRASEDPAEVPTRALRLPATEKLEEEKDESGEERRLIDPETTFLQPNVEDSDGVAAFVHVTADDMPLFVAVGYPKQPPLHGSRKEGREIAIEAMKLWETAIREHLPWFKLEFVEEDPGAPVQIVWKRRIAAGWGGFGGLRYWVRDGRLSVGGGMDVSTKPSNVSKKPLTKDTLRLIVAHEFGHVLGLGHCFDCDSAMNYSFETLERIVVTELDVRTFVALTQQPNGHRVDGRPLLALRSHSSEE